MCFVKQKKGVKMEIKEYCESCKSFYCYSKEHSKIKYVNVLDLDMEECQKSTQKALDIDDLLIKYDDEVYSTESDSSKKYLIDDINSGSKHCYWYNWETLQKIFTEVKKGNDSVSTLSEDYDKGEDILSVHWGNKTNESAELFDGQLILDFDKEMNVVGLELFDFSKELKKHDKKMEKIFGKEANGGKDNGK